MEAATLSSALIAELCDDMMQKVDAIEASAPWENEREEEDLRMCLRLLRLGINGAQVDATRTSFDRVMLAQSEGKRSVVYEPTPAPWRLYANGAVAYFSTPWFAATAATGVAIGAALARLGFF